MSAWQMKNGLWCDDAIGSFEPDPPMSAGFIVMTDPEGNEFCLD